MEQWMEQWMDRIMYRDNKSVTLAMMASSRPPPLCGASESHILYLLRIQVELCHNYEDTVAYVKFWLVGQFQNTGGKLRLIRT